MAFSTPTTKGEMYTVLKQIYSYYRLRQRAYENVDLTPLDLTRLSFTPLTDAQLLARATEMVKGEKQSEYNRASAEIREKILLLDTEYSAITSEITAITDGINAEYRERAEKIKKAGEKTGVKTDYTFDTLASLEREKAQKIAETLREKNAKATANRTEKTAYSTRLTALQNEYDAIYSAKADSKKEELKAAQEATIREIFIYNNGLDEKEQRYENQILQNKASLEIRYLDVTKQGFTKEQLVDMGYYADVITCVSAYYDTLEAVAAYNDIKNETGLIPYLDDYYDSVIYIYRTRAL